MVLALAGSASSTLFSTTCDEKSRSVVFVARRSTMTGFVASGAMVATYWSVLVTVRMAQTEITETGIRSDARTIRTQAVIPRTRRARGFFLGVPDCPDSTAV